MLQLDLRYHSVKAEMLFMQYVTKIFF
jgi:hypothetical protein